MVERSLSMREVPGSIPGISKFFKQGDSKDIFKIRENSDKRTELIALFTGRL